MSFVSRRSFFAALAFTGLVACGADDGGPSPQASPPTFRLNIKPAGVSEIRTSVYDGSTDDLLTGGQGKTGLARADAPALVDLYNFYPAAPPPAVLRRAAIVLGYQDLVDTSASSAYGTLYGPNVDANGTVTTSEGKIAGTEYLAYYNDGSGSGNVTLLVQVPDNFDPAHACIQAIASPNTTGVYGGISSAEWGLKRGCATALTDKGTGTQPHALTPDTVGLIDGSRVAAAASNGKAEFVADLAGAELAAYTAAFPDRTAYHFPHSRQNIEKDWGRFVLRAIDFAYFVLNEKYGVALADGTRQKTLVPGNTLVIASGVGHGGGAVIAAAETDSTGLINGVVASQPNIEMPASANVVVQRGGRTVAGAGRSFYDYLSTLMLYSPCLSSTDASTIDAIIYGERRCIVLHDAGLLVSTNEASQQAESLSKLRALGVEPEADHAMTEKRFQGFLQDTVVFANAYARSSVKDNLCDFSFGTNAVVNLTYASENVAIWDNRQTGDRSPGSWDFVTSNIDGARCLRDLQTDNPTVRSSIGETYRNGNLHGKPAMIVHGRDDYYFAVDHTSRPYLALNASVEGASSHLAYVEITNVQYSDVAPGRLREQPLHVYFVRALDSVYEQLRHGVAAPPSQVVRAVPGTPTTGSSVPPFVVAPAAGDLIRRSGNLVNVPD